MRAVADAPMEDELVTVQELYDRLEAEIAAESLRAHGIECVVSGEGVGLAFPVHLGPLGRLDVRVRRQDSERAREILTPARKPPDSDPRPRKPGRPPRSQGNSSSSH